MAEQAANENNAQTQQAPAPAQPTMTLDTAFNNIVQVVRAYRGTADEHDALRTSLQVIWAASRPAPAVAAPAPAEPAASGEPAN